MRIGGALQSISVAQPGAGAEWTVTVPANTIWELISAQWMLATSATVANRVAGLTAQDAAAHALGIWRGAVAQVASQTMNYALGPFDGQSDPNGNFGAIIIPAPRGIRLPAGFVLKSSSTLLQAGDQYSNILLAVEASAQ